MNPGDRIKRLAAGWPKVSSKYTSDKKVVSGTYEELLKLIYKKQSNWKKAKGRHFIEEDTQVAKKPMGRCSTPLAIREMQVHYTLIRMATNKPNQTKTKNTKTPTKNW